MKGRRGVEMSWEDVQLRDLGCPVNEREASALFLTPKSPAVKGGIRNIFSPGMLPRLNKQMGPKEFWKPPTTNKQDIF